MTNTLKQILTATTVLAFTACGGGSGSGGSASNSIGSGGSSGASVKKLTKMTSENEDGTFFIVTDYSYNANDLVEKSVSTTYTGNSEQGDVKSKTEAIYTYEKTYNMVKVVTKGYDANNQLSMTSTSWQTYNGDKIISIRGKTESKTDSLNMTNEGNYTDFVGPIATRSTLDTFDKDGKLFFHSTGVIKVLGNKDSNITTTTISDIQGTKTTSIFSILRTFDSLDRAISSELISEVTKSKSTYTYDSDTSKTEPLFMCFGGYVKMAENHRSKYPKSENHCYLKTEIKTDIEISNSTSTSVISYENITSNGLVTEQKMKIDNVVHMINKYEYK